MALRIVVIGGVALGPKAACRAKRLCPDAEVTIIDQSDRISYGGCGIPYFVSGEVQRVQELQATPYGTLRDPDFFRTHKGVTALNNTRATKIDRVAKVVTVTDLLTGKERDIAYDKLVLALGSSPNMPPIPGIKLDGISPATNLDEAESIRNRVQGGTVSNAVVVGGGFIGLEMAVALADMWGIPTSVVELAPQILQGFLSPTLAAMCVKDLAENDVTVFCDEKVARFEGEGNAVKQVVTDKRTLDADAVVMAAGIHANSTIAKDAGIDVTERGLIVVNDRMQTSDPDIYSGGDCATIPHLVTGKPGWFPLGSMANRQGRVVGTNIAGGDQVFSGAVGSWGIKLFGLYAAGAGLTITTALREGYDAINVHVEQIDRAHFYPDKSLMCLELVVDKPTRRVLGIQGVCPDGTALAARVNAVAPLLSRGCTVADISNLEVLYSPPFAAAMDVINVVGNVAENILEGRLVPMTQEEFAEKWAARDAAPVYFIDARVDRDAVPFLEKYPAHWHSIPQDTIKDNLDSIPADREIILICNTGLRSFEAQLDLTACGRTNTRSVMGGVSSAKRLGTL